MGYAGNANRQKRKTPSVTSTAGELPHDKGMSNVASERYNIQENLQTALDLAKAGIKVFPVTPDKHPLVKWKTEATNSPAKIRRLWRNWPDAMPAFARATNPALMCWTLTAKTVRTASRRWTARALPRRACRG